jgi:hypothetical protein
LTGQALQDAADEIAEDAAHEVLPQTTPGYRVHVTAR